MRTKKIKIVANATLGSLETISVFLMNKLSGEESEVNLYLINSEEHLLSVRNKDTDYEIAKICDKEIVEDMRGCSVTEETATVSNPNMSEDGASVYFDIHVPLSEMERSSTEDSVSSENILDKYSPEEIKKACFLHSRFNGGHRASEDTIFKNNFAEMDMDALYSFPTEEQDRLAEEWNSRMEYANTINPACENEFSYMLVPYDLELYGYTWETLPFPIPDELLSNILIDNIALAQYIKMCERINIAILPEDFKICILDNWEDSTDTTFNRIVRYYNKQ